jgi:hypothetical protein
MAKIVDEETDKAWKELIGKKNSEEKKEDNEEKKEEKIEEDKEIAAAWLTGGLEEEISTGRVVAPVLESNTQPVASLEDFAMSAPGKKKEDEEKKEVKYDLRMYETEGKYEDMKKEVYEESAENLFNRFVKPLDTHELRQDTRVRMPTQSELMGGRGETRDVVKYVERKADTSSLPFMKGESRAEFKKYRRA